MEKLINYILINSDYKTLSYGKLKYGLQVGIEMVICLVFNLLIAYVMGMVKEFVFFLLILFSLRIYCGGFHLERFGACFLCSSLAISGTLFVAKAIIIPNNINWIIIGGSLAFMILKGPVANRNKPLDDLEKQFFRKQIVLRGVAALGLALVFWANDRNLYFELIGLAFSLIIVSMIIGILLNLNEKSF